MYGHNMKRILSTHRG